MVKKKGRKIGLDQEKVRFKKKRRKHDLDQENKKENTILLFSFINSHLRFDYLSSRNDKFRWDIQESKDGKPVYFFFRFIETLIMGHPIGQDSFIHFPVAILRIMSILSPPPTRCCPFPFPNIHYFPTALPQISFHLSPLLSPSPRECAMCMHG